MDNTKEYLVEGIKQLVDINAKNLVSFETRFSIRTENPEDELQVAFVNQNQLDEGSEIRYNTLKGGVQDVFKSVNDKQIGYYLVFKGSNDKPVKTIISWTTVPLSPQSQLTQQLPQSQLTQQLPQSQLPHQQYDGNSNSITQPEKSSKSSIKDFVKNNQMYIIIGLIGIVGLVYFFWSQGKLDSIIAQYLPFLSFLSKGETVSNISAPSLDEVISAPSLDEVISAPSYLQDTPIEFPVVQDLTQNSFISELREL